MLLGKQNYNETLITPHTITPCIEDDVEIEETLLAGCEEPCKPEEEPNYNFEEAVLLKQCGESCKPNVCHNGKYLKKENYLSEFNTEYEKAQVRENLGIQSGDEIKWGNITGFIENQKDLNEKLSELTNKPSSILSVKTIDDLIKISVENKTIGTLCYVISIDTYYKLDNNKQWVKANLGNEGIPVYDKETLESLNNPSDKYISVPNKETDLNLNNLSREVVQDGSYVDILFSALRSLQHEVAKLKNTFNTGIVSYTGLQTASSNVITEEEEASEPLWAVDPEDLSELDELSVEINSSTQLYPNTSIIINDGFIHCYDSYYQLNTKDVEDSQLCVYTIIDPKDDWDFKLSLSDDLEINYNNLVSKQYCNIFTIVSRKTILEDDIQTGNNYIWISITDKFNNLICSGYYNTTNNSLQKSLFELENTLNIEQVYFKNIDLYKCSFYTRQQSFINDGVLPEQITTDDYTFKAAHITIRSVADKNTLDKVSSRILNNELIYVESESALYIKSNYQIKPISGGNISDNGMTQEELKQWLLENGYITSNNQLNGYNLSPIADLTFVHEGSNKKFEVSVDSQGNVIGKEINQIKQDQGNNETSFKFRGAVAHYNLENNYETTSNSKLSYIIEQDSFVKGDRVRISKWYIPNKDQNKFNCTHSFIEITNCGTDDYPLDNAVLHIVKEDPSDSSNKICDKFNLKGIVKANSSYIIRASKLLEFDSSLAHIKVKNYDYELWKNYKLYDLTGTQAIVLTHKNLNLSVDKNNKTKLKQAITDNTYFTQSVDPNLIDVVAFDKDLYNNYFTDNKAKTWVQASYSNPDNCIVKDQYFLDPAKQAFRSLTSSSETSNCRLEKIAQETIPLNDTKLSFYHSDQTQDVSLFEPVSNSNVCSDKSKLNDQRPNMVTCSFGINGYTTRCFNWISIGYFDEYLWLREKDTEQWIRFESYKKGDHLQQQSTTYPRKRIFNEIITNVVYDRIDGVFPANNQPYRSHKLIIDIVQNPVENKTFEYIVGRSLKNGNPDLEYCSETQYFTLHDNTWTPKVFHVTDQQGFTWVEYQVWSAAVVEIEKQIQLQCGEKEFPVIINTGDVSQNGTRINEWYDYFDACKSLLSKYEHQSVIGNNDLANSYSENFLGTGDDNGKSSPYYYNVFNCYEIPSNEFEEIDNWQHPLIYNNKYIPSTYYFSFDKQGYLMVNSEITTVTCNIYYNANDGDNIINLYTGYHNDSSFTKDSYCLKDTIEFMIDQMNGKNIISACHEMPFTVIGIDYLNGTSAKTLYANADRCIQYKDTTGTSRSLIGSHLNRISADSSWDNEPDNYWFSKMLESKGVKLCIGGHKHTYCCTYPIREFDSFKDVALQNVSTTKQAVIKRNDGIDGYIQHSSDYFKWKVDPNLNNGVVYFMLQATGFKLKSNKELPSEEQIFSKIVPKTVGGKTADVSQTYPMYAVISYSDTHYNLDLFRISGIKKESIENNKAVITEFSQTAYSTDKLCSEKLLIVKQSDSITYDNYWLVDNNVKNYKIDQQRCYLQNGDLKSMESTISGTWNSKDHTEIVNY